MRVADSLKALGWNDRLATLWQDSEYDQFVPGRVTADFGSSYKVATPDDVTADVSGRLQYFCQPHEMPKIGDWVALQLLDDNHGVIHGVLPRSSEIGRKQAGELYAKQVLAVNVDLAFLVQALDYDFSPERIRRYLFQLSSEGIEPIIVLNKIDKVDDVAARMAELETFGARMIATSAAQNNGIDEIAAAIEPGATAVIMGSSGVGKSTITNLLLGEERQATQAIREIDSKGRHTTVHRELFMLPNGGMVIDTPGLRELQLWGDEDDLATAFDDVEALIRNCQFSNCSHTVEPGCAILAALASGDLEWQRFDAYTKFRDELRHLNAKLASQAARERKQSNKKAQRHFNQIIRAREDREV